MRIVLFVLAILCLSSCNAVAAYPPANQVMTQCSDMIFKDWSNASGFSVAEIVQTGGNTLFNKIDHNTFHMSLYMKDTPIKQVYCGYVGDDLIYYTIDLDELEKLQKIFEETFKLKPMVDVKEWRND